MSRIPAHETFPSRRMNFPKPLKDEPSGKRIADASTESEQYDNVLVVRIREAIRDSG